jgi:hypothetical protein
MNIVIEPEQGWKPSTYYVVEVAMNRNNPIFTDIFYSGFLQSGKPNGYNKLFVAHAKYESIFYMKVIREIDTTIQNNHKLVTEVYPEEFI